jgi:hypothetical protein
MLVASRPRKSGLDSPYPGFSARPPGPLAWRGARLATPPCLAAAGHAGFAPDPDCWTHKEAFIKAHGQGLSLPLDQFNVSLVPSEQARLLAGRGGVDIEPWALYRLEMVRLFFEATGAGGDG